MIGAQIAKKDRDKVDGIVSKYTRALLGIAVKNGVPFSFVGRMKDKDAGIIKTSENNHKVVRALLGK